ncbi:hypothetical protein Tco_0054138 [Tanacetum coccineum]
MTTLADKAILSGGDNRPPMLEKDMHDSWKSRMELYMMNRQHGQMILKSVENSIQADFDVKATNTILQGLPPEVYALVSNHRIAKELWEKIQLLIFSLLLNDLNIYNVKLEQFQVNTKFLNALPPEWSKFMTDVKLVWDLHTTNIDLLHAYLGQHEFHVNEVGLMHAQLRSACFDSGLIVPVFQKGDDLIDAINHMMSFLTAVVTSRYPTTNNQLRNSSNPRKQATINDGIVT